MFPEKLHRLTIGRGWSIDQQLFRVLLRRYLIDRTDRSDT